MKTAFPILLVSLFWLTPGGLACANSTMSHHSHAGSPASTGDVDREQHPWGVAAAPADASRRIEVAMNDTLRFTPGDITVRQGETVTFVVSNDGALMHEFVLGSRQSIDEHAAMMRQFPSMEHAGPYMAHVAPGDTGEVTWTFNRGGTIRYACLVAGHSEAGMVGVIDVDSSAD